MNNKSQLYTLGVSKKYIGHFSVSYFLSSDPWCFLGSTYFQEHTEILSVDFFCVWGS